LLNQRVEDKESQNNTEKSRKQLKKRRLLNKNQFRKLPNLFKRKHNLSQFKKLKQLLSQLQLRINKKPQLKSKLLPNKNK
jgi:hypothetical protein